MESLCPERRGIGHEVFLEGDDVLHDGSGMTARRYVGKMAGEIMTGPMVVMLKEGG